MATHCSVLAWRIPGMGEPWWAAVYGVAQSRTQLKRLSRKLVLIINEQYIQEQQVHPLGIILIAVSIILLETVLLSLNQTVTTMEAGMTVYGILSLVLHIVSYTHSKGSIYALIFFHQKRLLARLPDTLVQRSKLSTTHSQLEFPSHLPLFNSSVPQVSYVSLILVNSPFPKFSVLPYLQAFTQAGTKGKIILIWLSRADLDSSLALPLLG